MDVGIDVYRARVGSFLSMIQSKKIKNYNHASDIFLEQVFLYVLGATIIVPGIFLHFMVSLTILCLITCFAPLIGLFRIHKNIPAKSKPFTCSILIAWEFLNVAVFCSFIIQILLLRSGVEVNPGPLKPYPSKLSFCHLNDDGFLARD